MAHSKPIPPLSLTIQGYGTNGEGVARLPDGMAVFLPGAMKGETCLVQVDKVGRQAAWGHVLQVETPSPFRIESLTGRASTSLKAAHLIKKRPKSMTDSGRQKYRGTT